MAATLTKAAIRWSLLGITIGGADREWRLNVVAALRALGSRTIEDAATPADVWASLVKRPADVLIFATELQGESIELVRRLRNPSLTPRPHIQIIVLTKDLSEDSVGTWVKAGVDYLCGWPASTSVVLTRLVRTVTNPVPKIVVPTYVGPDRRRAPRSAYNGQDRRRSRQR